MKKTATVILTSFLSFILSCELVVDVDIPLTQQQLVVNSFFNPDSLFEAHVSLNRHVLDDAEFIDVNNAQVGIYKENILIEELLLQGNGLYRGVQEKAFPKETYEIRVSVPNYTMARAQSFAPENTSIDLVEVGQLEIDQYERAIKITFTDPPNEKNYYQILLVMESGYEDWETGEIYRHTYPVYFSSDDPAFENNSGFYSDGLIFNDLLFDGKQITIPIKASFGELNEHSQLLVILRSLSEEHYNYILTTSLQNYNYGNPFAQPVQVYNNIENGFGIFAGYSEDVYEWKE